ncbi:MAG: TetR family transcriptional regulator [Ginsengibacter sp.]
MDKKELILQSALALFSANGYKGTSVRDIASAAEVNVALINYYFNSKEGLFEKVIEYRASFLKTLFDDLLNNTSLSPIEKLDIIIEKTIERKFSDPGFHHLLHRELTLGRSSELADRISDILLQNLVPVKAFIKKGIANGDFKEVDIELTITTLVGSIHYLLTSEIMARKILGKKADFNPFTNKKLIQRLNEHLRQLMRAHLLK